MLSIITAMIAAQMKMAAMQAQIEALEARPPEVVTEYVEVPVYITEYVPYYIETPVTETVELPAESVECGTCGAHVTDWWTIRNDADTDWVNVCELCYLRIAADDYYWPWDEDWSERP